MSGPLLADSGRVIAVDLIGFGDSEPGDRRPSVEDNARLVAEVIQLFGYDTATLVGNSMGGLISMITAVEHAARVDRLVLENRIGLGNGSRSRGSLGHAVCRDIVGGRKAPGTIGDDPDADTVGFGVDDVLNLVLTGDDELVEIATDANVGITRALHASGIQRDIGQSLLVGSRNRSGGTEQRDRPPEDGNCQNTDTNAP